MLSQYTDFLQSKAVAAKRSGFDVLDSDINPKLFDWQQHIVRWALRLGKAALFEECGLGKTFQQLEWARIAAERTGGKALILAPLAVAHQTVSEGQKLDIPVRYCRSQEEADSATEQIIVTNYDMLKAFDASQFPVSVLDESSILKAFSGKTRKLIQRTFEHTPYKLACTATPSPNDDLELGNHAEHLNVMEGSEMLARWFINDTMAAGNYRLRRHAVKDFWRWVTSWAVGISTPSDLGFSDDGFILPELKIHEHIVEVDHTRAFKQTDKYGQGRLFLDAQLSATSMWEEKRETAADRVDRARQIVGNSSEPWIIWCDTNTEADLLIKAFPEAVEVRGNHSIKIKEERLTAFSNAREQIIITKPDIAGFGLNWQHCPNQVFVGVTYSFEKLYQCLRRSWRFGVKQPVNAHLILAESESGIIETLNAKRAAFREMQTRMNEAMRENGLMRETDYRPALNYNPQVEMRVPAWLCSQPWM